MKDSYDPKNLSKSLNPEDYANWENLYATINDNLFHIGQGYDEKVVESVVCLICGGKEFNVGMGSHYTAIKCIKCEWEDCVHSG